MRKGFVTNIFSTNVQQMFNICSTCVQYKSIMSGGYVETFLRRRVAAGVQKNRFKFSIIEAEF